MYTISIYYMYIYIYIYIYSKCICIYIYIYYGKMKVRRAAWHRVQDIFRFGPFDFHRPVLGISASTLLRSSGPQSCAGPDVCCRALATKFRVRSIRHRHRYLRSTIQRDSNQAWYTVHGMTWDVMCIYIYIYIYSHI